MASIRIKKAGAEYAEILGSFLYDMECELWPEMSDTFDKDRFILSASTLLSNPNTKYQAFMIFTNEQCVGAMTVCEKVAVYAGGCFGEIMELFLLPAFRSLGIGQHVITFAAEFGKKQGWPFWEVGAPRQPRWESTLRFYHTNGFRDIGPRLELRL